MRPEQITRGDLTQALGEVDELSAAQLLSIGVTMSELDTAIRLVERERTDPQRETRSAYVAALVEVLREIADANEPEYLGTD